MIRDNWLTIALIIVTIITTLAGPALNAFVQARISQPKPKPKAKAVKRPRRNKVVNPNVLRFVSLVGIVVCIWRIYVVVNGASILISGPEAYNIAVLVSIVLFNIIFVILSYYTESLENELDDIKGQLRDRKR
jgi:hypothetical protein